MKIACLFFFVIVTLVHHSSAASCGTRDGEYIWDGSTDISEPTNATEFHENLDDALDQLPTNVTKIKLYNWAAVRSVDPNAAYTQAICIGYVDYKTCQQCIQSATDMLKEDCSQEVTSAILWYGDNCMVRYSDHNMVGEVQMPDKMIRILTNSNSSSSTNISLDGVRFRFFHELSAKTAVPGAYQMLAAGKWYDSSSKETIYGVAQCSWDLESAQCNDCLAIIGKTLESKFSGKVGGSIIGPSCNFRYELFPFTSNTRLFVDLTSQSTGKGSSIKALPLIYFLAPFLLISTIWRG